LLVTASTMRPKAIGSMTRHGGEHDVGRADQRDLAAFGGKQAQRPPIDLE